MARLPNDPVVAAAMLGLVPNNPAGSPVDLVVDRVIERLRRQSIASRRPGWIDPTFRSQSILFRYRHSMTTSGTGETIRIPVALTAQQHGGAFVGQANAHVPASEFIVAGNPEQMPLGYVGAVWASVQAFMSSSSTATRPMTELRWSAIKSGGFVAGAQGQFVGGEERQATGASTAIPFSSQARTSELPAAILLAGNDTLAIDLIDGTAAACDIVWDVVVRGWMFPDELSGQTAGSYWSD